MNVYTLSQWLLFFFLYSFFGWIWESCYVSLREHRWVNRGFMHGPMLPLYGSGAVSVLIITLPVRDNLPLVFIMGMIGATLLEFFTGMVMESLFHVRYWDYSHLKFNVKGYICPVASLCCFHLLCFHLMKRNDQQCNKDEWQNARIPCPFKAPVNFYTKNMAE